MNYTLLINNDNTIVATERHRIMQYSKLVDKLRFIVPKKYGDLDMENFPPLLQYRTPIMHILKIERPVLLDNDYKNDYLLYTMPISTSFTAESGDVELQLSFPGLNMDADGNVTEHNRETDRIIIPVIPVSNWFTVPDEALSTLTQYYLANQQQINALEDLAGILNQNKLDDITLDKEQGKVIGVVNGVFTGKGIDIEELGNELAEKTTEGLIKVNT